MSSIEPKVQGLDYCGSRSTRAVRAWAPHRLQCPIDLQQSCVQMMGHRHACNGARPGQSILRILSPCNAPLTGTRCAFRECRPTLFWMQWHAVVVTTYRSLAPRATRYVTTLCQGKGLAW